MLSAFACIAAMAIANFTRSEPGLASVNRFCVCAHVASRQFLYNGRVVPESCLVTTWFLRSWGLLLNATGNQIRYRACNYLGAFVCFVVVKVLTAEYDFEHTYTLYRCINRLMWLFGSLKNVNSYKFKHCRVAIAIYLYFWLHINSITNLIDAHVAKCRSIF